MRIKTFMPGNILVLGLAAISLLQPLQAETAIGDAGHYMNSDSRLFLNNPNGRPFTIRLFRFQWWIGKGWNQPEIKVTIQRPDKSILLEQKCAVPDDGFRLLVPAKASGVYTVDVGPGNTLNYWYLTSDLEQAVAWTGPETGDAVQERWFVASPVVPRTWYFYVPEDCRRFAVVSQNNSGRSQREDHGLTVFSPRGQRMAVLWGQANPDAPEQAFGKVRRRAQKAEILVEPGTAGRFWAIEVRHGDSHTFSDINLSLDGVPPYLARSPEEWFNPETGKNAPEMIYDETEFVQSDRSEEAKKRDPLIQHWTPCPALGDPDSCEIRTPADIALWNPEGRQLRFVIGTYLPRNMFPNQSELTKVNGKGLAPEHHDHANLLVASQAKGKILDTKAPLLHLHGHERWVRSLDTGTGLINVKVTEAEHFWMYTYPATPMVMIGDELPDGFHRFRMDAGAARNWYFRVPAGTKRFVVRAAAADQTDVMFLQVRAPDRTMAILYKNKGGLTVDVPPGLDDKIWHIRLDWGSSSRPFGKLPKPRFASMNVSLELKGVPPYLAPTWEQWFNPEEAKQ